MSEVQEEGEEQCSDMVPYGSPPTELILFSKHHLNVFANDKAAGRDNLLSTNQRLFVFGGISPPALFQIWKPQKLFAEPSSHQELQRLLEYGGGLLQSRNKPRRPPALSSPWCFSF